MYPVLLDPFEAVKNEADLKEWLFRLREIIVRRIDAGTLEACATRQNLYDAGVMSARLDGEVSVSSGSVVTLEDVTFTGGNTIVSSVVVNSDLPADDSTKPSHTLTVIAPNTPILVIGEVEYLSDPEVGEFSADADWDDGYVHTNLYATQTDGSVTNIDTDHNQALGTASTTLDDQQYTNSVAMAIGVGDSESVYHFTVTNNASGTFDASAWNVRYRNPAITVVRLT